MDIATLVMTAVVLRCGNVREAARQLGRAPSTISAAVKRFERSIAAPLLNRAGAASFLTLEARRMLNDIEAASDIARAMIAPRLGVDAAHAFCASRDISLTALQRVALVAETGSVRRAARIIRLGQPQLARQIARVEDELGRVLFDRSRVGVTPTTACQLLIASLGELEKTMQRLSRRARERFRSTNATIRLGAVMPLGHESNVARLLAFLVAAWHRDRPTQPLFVTNGTAEDLLTGLKDKRCDVALIDSDTIPADVSSRALVRSKLVVVGAREVLGDQPDVMRVLRQQPLALPSRRTGLGQAAHRLLAQLLPQADIDALTITEIDSIPIIANLMLDFGFVSVLPESALVSFDTRLVALPVDPGLELILSLVWVQTEGARRGARSILAALHNYAPATPAAAMMVNSD
ncbi:LysR family transcriptional regulator [Tardiphaga sp. 42S5]|uniref:LysR family transcriptional regulator n=1 Tax=Tardiphaga sp. 42S5 TaxID=1404799 RepID=UPI002A59EDBA|nr:LysR family transcriptional regulator [Tardiphaga sp. 42S5]WPO41225.1 LysR family transcriptional regulator [Tardiphaga sp. 42S5]